MRKRMKNMLWCILCAGILAQPVCGLRGGVTAQATETGALETLFSASNTFDCVSVTTADAESETEQAAWRRTIR